MGGYFRLQMRITVLPTTAEWVGWNFAHWVALHWIGMELAWENE